MYISQVIMASLPNIELVSFLIIITVQKFGFKSMASVYIFVLLEILTYGLSTWVICYLYVWAVLVLLAWVFEKINNNLILALVSGIFGLLFGTLCSFPYFFIGGFGYGVSWIISGIPYDLLHGAGNFLLMLLLYKPVKKAFDKVI